MRPVIVEPNGSMHDMRFDIESAVFSAGMTPRCIKCGDNVESISSFLSQALKSSSFVMLIGAMEPDGCGRQAAANVLSLPLEKNQKAENYIRERCAALGEDPERYMSCAMLPKGATILPGDNIVPACFCAVQDNVLVLMDRSEDEALLERLGALLLSLGERPTYAAAAAPAKVAAAAAELPFDEEKIVDYEIPAKKPQKQVYEEIELPDEKPKADITSKFLIACIIAASLLTITAFGIFLGTYFGEDEPVQASSAGKVVYKPVASSAESEDKDEEEIVIDDNEHGSESDAESSAASSKQPTESSKPASSQPVVVWEAEVSQALQDSSEPTVYEPEASSQPEAESQPETVISAPADVEPVSSQPESAPPASSAPEADPDEGFEEVEIIEEQEEEPEIERYSDSDLPSAKRSVFDDKLSYTSGSGAKKKEAYDLVCQILQNETRGNLHPEALKAHAVATYSMLKYNNQKGIAPWVILNSDVSQAVEDAVSEVLGVGVYYNGSFANAVYHSTSSGKTTSSEAVWGGILPYLTSVNSSFDKQSPNYKSTFTISSSKFADLVDEVYGIDLDGDPDDWIVAERDAPGGYVGTVTLGGETQSQGGSYGRGKKLTGRSMREQLFEFDIRSHCFEVEYDDDDDEFVFTVYGYGHGVGMSQYGAHFMAQEGYNFVEILHHYYSDTEVY